jgi:hypothetical protein
LIGLDKILLTLMLMAVVAMAGSYIYAWQQRQRLPYGDDDICNELAAIASDPQKMQYVREWMAALMIDEKFMAEAVKVPFFQPIGGVWLPDIHLDTDRLGFQPTLVHFNNDDGEDVRANGLRYAQIHSGRVSLIIQFDPSADLGAEWSAADRQKLREFSPGAFVLCDLSD